MLVGKHAHLVGANEPSQFHLRLVNTRNEFGDFVPLVDCVRLVSLQVVFANALVEDFVALADLAHCEVVEGIEVHFAGPFRREW